MTSVRRIQRRRWVALPLSDITMPRAWFLAVGSETIGRVTRREDGLAVSECLCGWVSEPHSELGQVAADFGAHLALRRFAVAGWPTFRPRASVSPH